MIRVVLWSDGRAYVARTAAAVVDAMRDDNVFTASKSRDEYLETVARRCWRADGAGVDCSEPAAFLAGLEAAGYIRQEITK